VLQRNADAPTGTVIRKPDFGVVRNDNPQPLLPLDCSYHGVFDLCVEALSDNERRGIERDSVAKKAEYAAGGVPEYYILHREPERQGFFPRMLKAIMVGLGAPISQKGNLHERAHKTHIDGLWSGFCAFAGGAGGGSYLPFPPSYRPFLHWDINQRYSPRAGFTDGWLKSKRRREDVQGIGLSLQAAMLDGILHI
jgi:hypothetical protein